jgi:hypothetical protein
MSERKAPTAPAVYVAGPLSGVKNVEGGFAIEQRRANAVKAVLVGDELCKLGFTPHIPHAYAWMRDEALDEHPGSDAAGQEVWNTVLALDEEMILRMDVVYRIEGVSAGADREVAFANANGIPVIYSMDEAEKFVAAWTAGNGADFADEAWNASDEGMKVRFCNSFELLCRGLGETAKSKGFWDIHKERALDKLRQRFFGTPYEPSDSDVDKPVDIGSAGATLYRGDIDELFKQVVEQLDLDDLLGDPAIYMALIGSECFEAIKALRDSPANWMEKDGVWEEVADTFIRLGDFVIRYGDKHGITPYGFAEKIFEKWEINKARPRVHGKRF